jgi:hypothetical protein
MTHVYHRKFGRIGTAWDARLSRTMPGKPDKPR